MAYDALEPIGEIRADYRIGLLCSIVHNLFVSAFSAKGKKPKLSVPSDFMLNLDADEFTTEKESKQQSVEKMKEVLLSMAKYQNSPKTRSINADRSKCRKR